MGIGTPSSQSRIPRPMELSLQPTFPTGTSHSHTDSRTEIISRSSSPTSDELAAVLEGAWSYVASGSLARYEPTQGRSPSASAPSRNGGQEPHDQNSITGRHVPGRGRAARRPGHAVHRLDRAPTTRWRGRLGPLVMGAAACFVRTMTGAGGSMRGRSAPPRAALLTLLAHLCMASAARWRGRAGRAVPAACVAAVPAAGLRALAAAPTRSGV